MPESPTSARLTKVLSLLSEAHSTDPCSESSTYHSTLSSYVTRLCRDAGNEEPSEALVIAANAQHVRRWEKPRNEYPMGLSGYKMWRTNLNRFHSQVARELMLQAGYSETSDAELFQRVDELLLKKTLARPPFKYPLKVAPSPLLQDPEMHLFEDAICLTFLSTQFVQFSDQLDDPSKMVGIVAKTWAKMSTLGRKVAAEELVGTLPYELKKVVQEALEGTG
ncbi:BZ3500_MvSof-1268-A1-R1_Chr8-2g10245 [Microbotryum saponariae]|uniref:BZ3500_MvSof-1268-A1-R1_Chr8-2g10245 protein n=1 Tax=Microbotryum saponariae TaxID=289078 RepID=A0A2X0KXB2_9BASI|nr:BZ3500_MvSof-1268-A1-R1_Chr8-2g10245 [Microbotryum saponariae]SDA02043.1 BZ3501_MvSof-1269-A2-R1_Chr8-2g09995 [Microbotryum saponariae]